MKNKKFLDLTKVLFLFVICFMVTAVSIGCGNNNIKPSITTDVTNTVTPTNTIKAPDTPAATPTETVSATPSPTEEPTPTPDSHEGMVRSSLTNEWVDEKFATQRPIAVMMNNLLPGTPQTGISRAGVVYECKVEGNITRLLSVIEDYEDLEKIGSVRSVRKYYVFWAFEWDAILLHYGGPEKYVKDTINRKDVNNLDGQVLESRGVFYRTKDRVAPHNAYGSGAGVLKGVELKNYSLEHTDRYVGPTHFQFADDENPTLLSDGQTARIVRPGYQENKPWFEYNAEEGIYYRYQYGKEQIDDMNNEHLTCKNIIIQFAQSETYDDGYKAFTTNDKGKGGYFITNGKAVPITWTKASDYEPTRFYYAANGEEIKLNTGKTWICVVRLQDKNDVKIEE